MNKNPNSFSGWAGKKGGDLLGDQFWSYFDNLMPRAFPAIDLFEADGEGHLFADIPGINQLESLQIKAQGAHLTLNGEIPYPYSVPEEVLLRKDRYFGKFERTVLIPFSYDPNSIAAAYENGVLHIVFKKVEKSKDVQINLQND
ncbi:Hsp20/alpha crystallin family protein [Peribacillus kribbensis]|uniref:Hsp20/alpha crystallin family protein n=1 Tax=Peribacillus kribbensis TaxID=356658 RepID=UPI00041C74B7|nr:Hsp20/alpha crystallin family protein [Peribacillus kribbensis]